MAHDRRHERIGVRISVQVTVRSGSAVRQGEGVVTNLSQSGAFVQTELPAGVGDRVEILVLFDRPISLAGRFLPDSLQADSVTVPAQSTSTVRWATPPGVTAAANSGKGFGIEFEALSTETTHVLGRLLQYYTNLIKAGVTFEG